MDEKVILALAIVLGVVVILSSFGLALWIIAKLRRNSDRPLFPGEAGAIVVPVRRLARAFPFFGSSENSISPRFEIARDGLRFKIFRPDHWPFVDIGQVDAPRLPFVTRIAFVSRTRGRLFVDVADKAKARDLLRALPPGLPLSRKAIALRDGGE